MMSESLEMAFYRVTVSVGGVSFSSPHLIHKKHELEHSCFLFQMYEKRISLNEVRAFLFH